nr:UDP-3-O-(3-hydroxymyristoyl)glucosamine N-acyltransferase [Planctomycetota bacterium]
MRATVRDIAAVVSGSVIGDADLVITGISSLTEAAAGDISFLANQKYAPYLAETKASAVLVASAQDAGRPGPAQIVVANPDYAFATVVATFGPKAVPPPLGVHPTAIVGERVRLGSRVAIGAYVVIGDDAQI